MQRYKDEGATDIVSGVCELSAVNQVQAEASLRLYPNPAHNAVVLNLGSYTNAQITVADFTGKILIQTTANTSNFTLDISNLAAGMYMVICQSEGVVYSGKMVVSE